MLPNLVDHHRFQTALDRLAASIPPWRLGRQHRTTAVAFARRASPLRA